MNGPSVTILFVPVTFFPVSLSGCAPTNFPSCCICPIHCIHFCICVCHCSGELRSSAPSPPLKRNKYSFILLALKIEQIITYPELALSHALQCCRLHSSPGEDGPATTILPRS